MRARLIAMLVTSVACALPANAQYKTDKELRDEAYEAMKVNAVNTANSYIGKTYWYRPNTDAYQRTEFYPTLKSASAESRDRSKVFHPQNLTSFEVLEANVDDRFWPILRIKFTDGLEAYMASNSLSRGLDHTSDDTERISATSPEEEKRALLSKRLAAAKLPKKQGVAIGMTKSDVLASSWGRPQSVNKTTTAGGTHEQWVYGGGYLYFENGVLTTIQN